MVTGLGPRDADRLALAAQFGADSPSMLRSMTRLPPLTEQTGGLADVAVDVTASGASGIRTGDSATRPLPVVAGTRRGQRGTDV